MRAFDDWLEDLANRALPGGVAAAAIAAAMGAALVAKVAGATLKRQPLVITHQQSLAGIICLAQKGMDELQQLAAEDERAYRQVLQTRALAREDAERRLAWHRATDVPLRVAEVCHDLLLRTDLLADASWSVVVTDLRIGQRLLVAGLESGLDTAEENLRAWARGEDAQAFESRIRVVRGE